MKTKITPWIFLFMISIMIVAGCKSANSPGKVAERFLNAFNERKYDEARKYASPDTDKLVDLMENLSKMSTSVDSIQHKRVEVTEEKIEGDTAFVTFREVGSEETDQIKLIKSEGKWLVHITKTDLSSKQNSVFDTNPVEEVVPDSGEAGAIEEDTLPEATEPVSK